MALNFPDAPTLNEEFKQGSTVWLFDGVKWINAAGGSTEYVLKEVETIFPAMVTQREGYIDGQKVTDFRDINTSELLYALVNSVKTLTARLEALEGGATRQGVDTVTVNTVKVQPRGRSR